jgi:hypothetical protein
MNHRSYLLSSALVLLATLSSCASGRPARRDAFHAEGFYVGVMQTSSQVYGDLDEELIIDAPEDFGMIPSFDGEVGYGVAPVIGYRWHRRALELSGAYTDYGDPEFLGTPIPAEQWGVGLDWKEYYNVDSAFQPYIYLGVSSLRMNLEDAAASLISAEIADVELEGFGINLGGGASLYLTPHLAVFGQLHWSFVSYNQAETVFPPDDLDGQIDGDGWTAAFGASWTF